MFKKLFLLGIISLSVQITFSQENPQWTGSEILHQLKKLNVMGSVLYVAAHPDDENTRLITWLSNEKLVETGYISLTRGDGGQNLIGSELEKELGVIRTYELLEARKVDGGIQFFSRAYDFGYSKTTSETFKEWNKKKILGDLLWIVRRFQPDVIITRFSTEPGRTHGHHTSSAIFAAESFEISADTNEYYEQFQFVNPWKPQRILWNTSSWFFANEKDFKKDTFIQVDVGTFNPLLGASYTEIAAFSRSKHKSQGFGSLPSRGETIEYFTVLKGTKPENNDLLSGIDLTWNRVKNGKKIGDKLNAIIKSFNVEEPSASVSDLLQVYIMMNELEEKSPLVVRKMGACRELIRQCLGFYMDVYTDDYIYAVGDTIRFKVESINRLGNTLSYFSLKIPNQQKWILQDFSYNRQVNDNSIQKWTSQNYLIKEDAPISNPVWWETGSLEKDYEHYVQSLESDYFSLLKYQIEPSFNGASHLKGFVWEGQIRQKIQDPVLGELVRPVYIAPPVTVNFTEQVYVQPGAGKKEIQLELKAFKNNVNGSISLELPKGWTCEPKSIPFTMKYKRQNQFVKFTLSATDSSQTGLIKPIVSANEKVFQLSYKEIKYPHIPSIVLFPPSEARLVNIPVKKSTSKIAYIQGAGDEVANGLSQIGYQVDVLQPNLILANQLKEYQAVIVGIRAYNTLENIAFIQDELLKYVEAGGNVIVQYITTASLKSTSIGPYKLKIGRDRVTDEKSPMNILVKNHPVFNFPNRITEDDFNGWVQERGLYFASEWDEKYTPLLGCNDAGEEEKKGAMLIATYGKGYFVYTGISFFRQIPEGVPGAYRLMVNLIEL